jgi:hypothetical protein
VISELSSSSHGFCSPFAGGRVGGNDLERLAHSAALVATDIASRATTAPVNTARPDARVTFRFTRARGDACSRGAEGPTRWNSLSCITIEAFSSERQEQHH